MKLSSTLALDRRTPAEFDIVHYLDLDALDSIFLLLQTLALADR